MKFTAVLVLLAFAAVARAQIQICDGNRKVRGVASVDVVRRRPDRRSQSAHWGRGSR
jgi:hypothetical protein